MNDKQEENAEIKSSVFFPCKMYGSVYVTLKIVLILALVFISF